MTDPVSVSYRQVDYEQTVSTFKECKININMGIQASNEQSTARICLHWLLPKGI